jgi:hypothetical protein
MSSLLGGLRSTLNPDIYHGASGSRPFFEGWYFKLVDASEAARYAIIPGVSRGADPSRDHAFVQVLDGATGRVEYAEYPVAEFVSAPDRFDVVVGGSRFTRDWISLDVDRQGCAVRGRLDFQGRVAWPRSVLSPGLAFPAGYIWFQSNHFATPGTSLTASLAVIPWLRGAFPGFIVGLLHAGCLHRFATYTGARTEALDVGDREVVWTVRDRRRRLTMRLAREGGGILRAPTTIAMDRRIVESLSATAEVRLEEIGARSRVVFEGSCKHGGLEAAGDLDRLVAMHRSSG